MLPQENFFNLDTLRLNLEPVMYKAGNIYVPLNFEGKVKVQ